MNGADSKLLFYTFVKKTSMISVEGMEFFAFHGCTEDEKKVGIHFEVDVWIDVDVSVAADTDDINDALNYQIVYKIVSEQMKQTSSLLEHVAGRIKKQLAATFPQSKNITIKISKMNPPLGGKVKRVSITV